MSSKAEIEAFKAELAALEAARTAPEPVVEPAKVEPEVKIEPAKIEPEAKVEPVVEAKVEPEAETEVAETEEDAKDKRIQRGYIEAREAKRQAEALRRELEILKGTRTETTDENVIRLAEQRATEMTDIKMFNAKCDEILEHGNKEYKDFGKANAALWETLGGFNRGVVEAAIEAGEPHKLIRYLGVNPDEAERIAQMTPVKAGVALSRIATRLATPPPPKVSKAPAPIEPINTAGSGATGSSAPDLETMDMAAYAKYRLNQIKQERMVKFGYSK